MNERMNYPVLEKEWMKEWMILCLKEWMNDWMHKWMKEWRNERIQAVWMNELLKKWMIERINQIKERMKDGLNERTNKHKVNERSSICRNNSKALSAFWKKGV